MVTATDDKSPQEAPPKGEVKTAPVPPAAPKRTPSDHPAGSARYGGFKQIVRLLLLITYFNCCCCVIFATQAIGVPLYFWNRQWYYVYMSLTKQSFGLLVTTMTEWWSPTKIRICGDKSVKGQLKLNSAGLLECDFPERLVLIANHQLYSDWLYLWWIAYTARAHGAIYIILKESLKWIPVIGWGMQFYGFIFLARNWQKDKSRFKHRLQRLAEMDEKSGERSPFWLLIFPEGTNLSKNGREKSRSFAQKTGIPDLQHQMLPRTTGLQYCLQELNGSVEWLYDCTMAYEGVARDKYGQDMFTLRSTYLEGRPPKSVNLHFRRFRIADIPYKDPIEFEKWLRARWIEKDELLEKYLTDGHFPGDDEEVEVVENGVIASEKTDTVVGVKEVKHGQLETEVKLRSIFEITGIFVVLAVLARTRTAGLVANVVTKLWQRTVGILV